MVTSHLTHEYWMSIAIQQARLSRTLSMPNPSVGCVLVKNDELLAAGHTQQAGSDHAEVNALNKLNGVAEGATAYVTLEPCNHYGRTPPCTQALIKAGVQKVVIGMLDPNPIVAGKGVECLEEAGIDVVVGICEQAARQVNKGYIKRMTLGLPRVYCKLAMSFDGRTAMASGESQWITGEPARRWVQSLRATSCAIITGVNTVNSDDARLTVRGIDRPHQPLRVVLDSQCRLNSQAKILKQAGCTVIVNANKAMQNTAIEPMVELYEQSVVTINLPCDLSGRIDLNALMQWLAAQQCNEVLVESGSIVAGQFLQHALLDELYIMMAPVLMGSDAKPLFTLPLAHMSDKITLSINDMRAIGDDWLIQATPNYHNR